jgi:acyl-CoA reductase-like NAD-dependent aldehyde dehydrogenase
MAWRHILSTDRVAVRKTYKLYINGQFPRSESGRSYPVNGSDGELLAYAALASRKDLRDAVTAARSAFGGWSRATAYNRGQILYRIAEMMEGRRAQFVAEIAAGQAGEDSAKRDVPDGKVTGVKVIDRDVAEREVSAAIDRWVYYAGWADKYAQVAGGTNPVAGPYYNFSTPEPSGVVGVVAPDSPSLLGFVSVVAPALAVGNTVVVIASPSQPLAAITLSEALATSDLPAGVLNILTGDASELTPWLASHRDVNCLDLTGIAPSERGPYAVAAADTVKRVYAPRTCDWYIDPDRSRLDALVEIKTVWHTVGI